MRDNRGSQQVITPVEGGDYKYQSTGAKGKTTFSKLTDKWRDAQFPGAGKGKQVGTGKE